MHVAYYAPAWPPRGAANGIVTYVAAMRDYLVEAGHRVSVVTLTNSFTYTRTEEVVRHTGPAYTGLRQRLRSRWDGLIQGTSAAGRELAVRFRKLHAEAPIDLVEMEESFGWSSHVDLPGVPVVVRLHGPHFRSPKYNDPAQRDRWSRTRERAERRAIAAATRLSSPSRAIMVETCKRYRASQQGRVIPNPVSITQPADRWSYAGSDPDLLLWVGQFSLRKGADIILDAFSILADRHPNLRLVMVGPDLGLNKDGKVYKFEDYTAAHLPDALRERVTFRGLLQPGEIATLRRQATLTAVTSRVEVFPYIVAEAMAAGTPVVSTPWVGVEEMISHEKTGWISEDMSGQSLAMVIDQALSDESGRIRIAEVGWDHCKARFSLSVIGAETLRFYEEVIGRPQMSPASEQPKVGRTGS